MITKEMISKCNSVQIPSFIWVRAHMLYAKVLEITHKPDRAINILKCIAQVLPTIRHQGLEYTKTIQQAKSLQQHLKAASSVNTV